MSQLSYYKKASKKKSSPESSDKPVVNRFHDVRKIDKRRHDVLDYLMCGFDADEISDFLGVSKDTIETDIEEIVKIGYQARDEEVDAIRDELIRTYRLIRKEGFRGFKKSQGTVETVTTEFGEGGEGGNGNRPPDKQKVKTEEKAGDANLLRVAIDANKEIGKVSGAQKHKEISVQNTFNQNNTTNILSPHRTEMPKDFDPWLKKPDDAELPDENKTMDEVDQDIEVED